MRALNLESATDEKVSAVPHALNRSGRQSPTFVRQAAFQRLPKRAQAALLKCPRSGNGVHGWLFAAGCVLHDVGIHPDAIEQWLEIASLDCGRQVDSHEISDAVQNSAVDRRSGSSGNQARKIGKPVVPRWPERNYSAIEGIVRRSLPFCENVASTLCGDSDDDHRQTDRIVEQLFPDDPLICCGWRINHVDTRRLSDWRGQMAAMPFIVPSPMTAREGKNQKGEWSRRCLDNTGPRRFLVVEFDFKEKTDDGIDTPDVPLLRSLAASGISVAQLNLALHFHLAKFAPLVLVVHSGSKSEHGWYFAAGQTEERVRRFMDYAVSLGADRATFTKCQLVRMPDGTRVQNGKRQCIRYFNPGNLE